MPTDILNIDMIDDNHCFGCGHANPHGLHIEVRRDPEDRERLIGTFDTNEHTAGFPGVTHGGALYTAFDCLSTWVATIFRKEEKALWILRSAETIYHMPAIPGTPVHLSGRIIEDNGPWKPARVHTEGRNDAGDLLAECTFKVVPIPIDKLKEITGLDELPPNWLGIMDRDSLK